MLVIDDMPLLGAALHRTLSDASEVVVVNDAAAALELLRSGERFDVVLCDVGKPRMDGIAFHRQVAIEMPQVARRIVLLSGGARTLRADEYLEGVPNLVIERPVDVDGLSAVVERRVEFRRPRPTAPSWCGEVLAV